MVTETNRTTEARRKALRKGDEDPVVVAQRYLNIYRQMHILSGERREAFNKMLVALSPDVKSIFSTLPGGAMLQDYIDELTGTKSGEDADDFTQSPSPGVETYVQPQATAGTPTAPIAAVSGKISFDKEFSAEFTKIIAGLLQQQAITQKESLEKVIKDLGGSGGTSSGEKADISLGENFAADLAKSLHPLMQYQSQLQKESLAKLVQDISKTQLYIAKNIKEGYSEHQQEFKELCKVIAAKSSSVSSPAGGENISGIDIKELLQTISDNYLSIREDQNKEIKEICNAITEGLKSGRDNSSSPSEIKELCNAIIQSQKSLGQSLSGIKLADGAVAAPMPVYDDGTTQKLIEAVIEGQKQINLRLDKVEEMSLNKANDNINLIEAFKATQEELFKKFGNNRPDFTEGSQAREDNSEKLLKLINDSQEKLIKAVMSSVSANGSNKTGNGNETVASVMVSDNQEAIEKLINKISSLQASNEKNLEKAITKAIEAQGEIFGKLSNRKNEELIETFTRGVKEILTPMLVTQIKQEAVADISRSDRFASPAVEKNIYEPAATETELNGDVYAQEPYVPADNAGLASDTTATKKKKKKKKKKSIAAADSTAEPPASAVEPLSPDDDFTLPAEDIEYDDLPEVPAATDFADYEEPQTTEGDDFRYSGNTDEFDVTPDDAVSDDNTPLSNEAETTSEAADYSLSQADSVTGNDETADSTEIAQAEAEDVSDDSANTGFDWGFNTQDENNSDIAGSNILISDDSTGEEANDWGFGSTDETEDIQADSADYPQAQEDEIYSPADTAGNDNSDQDWEWVYVEDDEAAADEYSTEEVAGSDIGLNRQENIPQKLKLQQFEEEDFDPYQNSVLKD